MTQLPAPESRELFGPGLVIAFLGGGAVLGGLVGGLLSAYGWQLPRADGPYRDLGILLYSTAGVILGVIGGGAAFLLVVFALALRRT